MTFGTDLLFRSEDLPSSVTRIEQRRPNSVDRALEKTSSFAETERNLILRALEANDWNKTRAAAMLEISRKKLYAKVKKYQLESTSTLLEPE